MRQLEKIGRAISFFLFVFMAGCAVQAGGEEGESASAEQAMNDKPRPDDWLALCTLKGGKENTPPGGVRMCCFSDGICVNDPGSIKFTPLEPVPTPKDPRDPPTPPPRR